MTHKRVKEISNEQNPYLLPGQHQASDKQRRSNLPPAATASSLPIEIRSIARLSPSSPVCIQSKWT